MTAYRDDNDALRARLADAEARLAASEALVARLEGRGASLGEGAHRDALVGAVLHLVEERGLPVELGEAGLEAIARVLRTRLGLVVTADARSLTARPRVSSLLADGGLPRGAFALTTGPGGTTMRLELDVRRLAIVVALGPVLGAIASLPVFFWEFFRMHDFLPPTGALLAVPALMVAGGVAVRWLAKRHARAALASHAGAWATLLRLAEEHARPLARVRVEDAEDQPISSESGPSATRIGPSSPKASSSSPAR